MKFFKRLFIFLSIIVLLIGGGVGLLAYMVIDNTSYINENYENNELDITLPIYDLVEEALHNTSSTNQIKFVLDPEKLDYILYSVINSLEEQIQPININGSKVECIDGIYYLKVSLGYQSINTVVDLELDFEEQNDTFTIFIKDLKLGKLGLNNNFVHSIIDNIDISQVIKTLEQNKIYCSLDLKTLSVSITKQNLIDMVKENTISNPHKQLINVLLDIYKNNQNLYEFETENNVSFILDLLDFKYNELYGIPTEIGLNNVDILSENLLANSLINQSQVDIVFFYLLNGYASLENEEKSIIDNLDLTSVGIYSNSSYKGLLIKNNLTLKEHISSTSLDYTLGDTSLSLVIEEPIMNSIIQNSEMIGSTFAFGHSNQGKEEYHNKVSFIGTEHLILDFIKDKIELDFILNVNGCRLGVHADFTTLPHSGLIVEGNLNSLSLGNIQLNEEQKINLLNYMNTLFHEDYISISSNEQKIKLDFSNLIFENETIRNFADQFENALISTSINDDNITIIFGI
ncbi:MAG: hypothetical protein E7177_04540 [Erysipelotrichaceae bacterium]|nr:hypothetical protein [Erysipelotrichaceae bacterium]